MNIISTHLQTRKEPIAKEEQKKGYRIRQSTPFSCGKRGTQFSPYKTFMKKLETPQNKDQTEAKP